MGCLAGFVVPVFGRNCLLHNESFMFKLFFTWVKIVTTKVKVLSKKKKKTSSFTSNLCGIPGVNVWNPKLMGSQVSTKNSGNKEGRSMYVEGEMLYVHVK